MRGGVAATFVFLAFVVFFGDADIDTLALSPAAASVVKEHTCSTSSVAGSSAPPFSDGCVFAGEERAARLGAALPPSDVARTATVGEPEQGTPTPPDERNCSDEVPAKTPQDAFHGSQCSAALGENSSSKEDSSKLKVCGTDFWRSVPAKSFSLFGPMQRISMGAGWVNPRFFRPHQW